MLASDSFRYLINSQGRVLRLRYYSEVIGSVWDDQRTLTSSGTDFYISGLVQEVNPKPNSRESVLVEQGRLMIGDKAFYLAGSVDTTSGIKVSTITISGLNEVYREIPPGMHIPQMQSSNIYRLTYGRLITTGSLT